LRSCVSPQSRRTRSRALIRRAEDFLEAMLIQFHQRFGVAIHGAICKVLSVGV